MPSKEEFAKKELARKQSKRLPPISVDAALFTSTILTFFLNASNSLDFRNAVSKLTIKAQEKPERSEEFSKMAMDAIKPVFEKNFVSSCEMAANLLAFVLFLEKIYKRLNLQDPRDIVTILYCTVRIARSQKEFDEVRKMAINELGKNWLWPLVWNMALTNEVVKKRWDTEEAKGRLNLYDWQDDCQKFANNYWSSRRTEFQNVKAQKAKMISSLRKTLGIQDKEVPQNG